MRSMPVPAYVNSVSGPVLLFDGECGLCQRVVRFLLRLDRPGRLRFAPLQGSAAQAYLWKHGLDPVDFGSLVFIPDWNRREQPEFLLRTDGAIAALRSCGGLGTMLAFISILPRAWRDAAYRLIARWRYRIFGRWRPRPLAKTAWAERFIE